MMTSGIIIGAAPRFNALTPNAATASRSAAVRRQRDIADNFYPTPPEATRALLSVETFEGPIHEPACGEGHIARELSAAGHTVVATDLNDRGFGSAGLDFLGQRVPLAQHIVTNPPYGRGLADAFAEKALAFAAETGGIVAMLLNMASLSHRRRTAWWKAKPPARLYAIDDIVCWPSHRYGPAPEYFTKHRYIWAVWTPNHQGPSAFWWLSGAEFRAAQSSRNNNKKRRPL